MKRYLNMLIQAKIKALVLSLFIVTGMQAQDLQQCQNATKITIDLVGNIMPNTNQSHFLTNTQKQFVLFYKKNSHSASFWYQIQVLQETDLSLIIKPQEKGNLYNFFVYQDTKTGDFCQQIANKNILPIRTNLLKDTSNTKGSGLSIDSEYKSNGVDYLYNTAFHDPIHAQKGDIFYINVYHTEGKDCGHTMELGTNQSVQSFLTVHDDCYQDSLIKTPAFIPILDPQLAGIVNSSEKKFTNKLILKGLIADSLSHQPLQAEMREYIKKQVVTDTMSQKDGNFLFIFEGHLFYELEVSALGYKSKRMKFMKQTLQHELRDLGTIYLSPLDVGEHFVLKDIYFHSGTYAITTESNESLEKLKAFLETFPNTEIEIQGHTNGKGKVKQKVDKSDLGPEWNFSGNEKKLSKLRAQAVKDYLVKNGIAESRIEATGYGAEKMLYPKPKNKEERDLNKRVEIIRLK